MNLIGQYGGTPRALAVDGRRVYFGVGMHLAMADVGGATPGLVAESPMLPGAVRVVAVQGRWVYVGAGPQLAVFAASPGDAPLQPITSVPLPGPVSALAVAERYAWAVAGQSLVVFDLAEPATPRQAGMLALPAPSRSIALRGPYAYLAAADGGLRVLDLSTPTAPREVGAILRTPTVATWAPDRVAVVGSHLCVSSGSLIHFLSLQDPTRPDEVAVYEVDGGVRALAAADHYVYFHCGNECCGGPVEEFRILDLADPRQPRLAGTLGLRGRGVADLAVDGAHAYLVVVGNLHVIDVGEATAPRLAASLQLPAPAVGGVLAVAGRFAYLAAVGALLTIDAGDPANPRLAGESQGITAGEDILGSDRRTLGALAVSGDLACATAWREGDLAIFEDGMAILSLRDPARPRLVGYLPQPGGVRDVGLAAPYAYLAGGPGLVVVDLAEPARPQQIACASTEYGASHLALAGRYAYVSGAIGSGAEARSRLWVFDIADPATPRPVARLDLPLAITDLALADHALCLLTVEQGGDGSAGSAAYALQMVDLADPARPRLAGSLPLPDQSLALAAGGAYAYVAGGERLLAVEVANPDAPRIVGSYDAPSRVDTLAVSGGDLYATVWEAGLLILRPVANSQQASTGDP